MEGTRVTLRTVRTDGMQTVGLTHLVTTARCVVEPPGKNVAVGVVLVGLTAKQREQVAQRAEHVREVLTGVRSGRADRAAPGEPDLRFAEQVPLQQRYVSKAAQLGVGLRRVER